MAILIVLAVLVVLVLVAMLVVVLRVVRLSLVVPSLIARYIYTYEFSHDDLLERDILIEYFHTGKEKNKTSQHG